MELSFKELLKSDQIKESKILALHGFLGQGSDWPSLPFWERPNFFQPEDQAVTSELSFPLWAQSFLETYQGDAKTLVGYSLGGRLALHLYEQSPHRWERLILISTHLGLKTFEEKTKRVEHDREWAERFRFGSWDEVLRDWNKQEVFSHDKESSIRKEENFSREKIALALENWSTGRQKNFRGILKNISIPVHYIVGERDIKYVSFAQELKELNPDIYVEIIPGKGHRIFLDLIE